MRLLVSLSMVLTALPLLAASPYGNGFASGNPKDYLEGNVQAEKIRIASVDGVNSLVITASRGRLKAVPVMPNTRYTLSFDGSFTGDVETIEENPRFEVFTRPGRKSPVLPSREIHFLDAAGKVTGRPLVFSMPFRGKRTYTDVFHTPPNAVALRLDVASGDGITLAMQNLKLAKTAV